MFCWIELNRHVVEFLCSNSKEQTERGYVTWHQKQQKPNIVKLDIPQHTVCDRCVYGILRLMLYNMVKMMKQYTITKFQHKNILGTKINTLEYR